jgi:DNA polymerase III epsilon subunit-like protein
MLTGITDAMVRVAPPIDVALVSFLEFARGSVLVAHNAPFDISFLKAAAAQTGQPWPGFQVVDTAHLARQVVHRDEAPNRKLITLARLFRSATTPDHRALTDARATVDVLHALLERVGSVGVHSLEELSTFTSRVSTAQRRKRYLADGLPHLPGVYVFRDARDQVLYVGTSRNIATRVRTYFTASEHRTRMAEMVAIAERVVPVVCQTPARGAGARAAPDRRAQAALQPALAVSLSARPWVKLTVEPFPRLSLVHAVRDDGATYLGPFGSRRSAEQAVDAMHDAFALRQCSRRLGPTRRRRFVHAGRPRALQLTVHLRRARGTPVRRGGGSGPGRDDRRLPSDGRAAARPDQHPRRHRAVRAGCGGARPDARAGASRSTGAAPCGAGRLRRAGGRSPTSRRRLGDRAGPARPPRRDDGQPARRRPLAVRGGAARAR